MSTPKTLLIAYRAFPEGKISFEMDNCYPTLIVYENGGWTAHTYLRYGESFYSKCSDYIIFNLIIDNTFHALFPEIISDGYIPY